MTAHGKFVWHDLMTTDVAAAKPFYGELFGWKLEKGDHGDYIHIKAGERHIGGMMALETKDGIPPHWIGYVGSDDVDATVKRVPSIGGKVLVPTTEIPRVGKFAVVADPQGATFSPFNGSDMSAEPDRTPGPGEFCWDELITPDPEAAVRFYSELYGLASEGMPMGPMGTYWLLKRGDKNTGGVMKTPPGAPPMAHWLTYIAVASADATVALAEKLGGKVHSRPIDIPNVGRFAVLGDSVGAAFAVLEPPS